jgi:hypothetical protein
MFTGLQEILVLVIIILVVFFLPRIMNRGQEKRSVETEPSFVLSGKMRLALAASFLWPAAIGALMQPWEKDPVPFLYLGLGPVAVAWIIYWVFVGFRKYKN